MPEIKRVCWQRRVQSLCKKVFLIVIPSEARNLSGPKAKRNRDSSAKGAPRFTVSVRRERNDDLCVIPQHGQHVFFGSYGLSLR